MLHIEAVRTLSCPNYQGFGKDNGKYLGKQPAAEATNISFLFIPILLFNLSSELFYLFHLRFNFVLGFQNVHIQHSKQGQQQPYKQYSSHPAHHVFPQRLTRTSHSHRYRRNIKVTTTAASFNRRFLSSSRRCHCACLS